MEEGRRLKKKGKTNNMNETSKNKSYIGYEYKNITVSRDMESVYADGYQNFGWEMEENSSPLRFYSSTLKFKRDRRLRNKAELTRLQRQFDACVNEIENLSLSETTTASIVAYSAGILGTAFMAGATFSYLAAKIPLMIVLAVPGIIGWVVPYFSYRILCKKRAEKVAPLIDQKYDEIYEVCEKANSLLA